MQLPIKNIPQAKPSSESLEQTQSAASKSETSFWQKYVPTPLKPWVHRLTQPTMQSILIITALVLGSRALGFVRQVLIYQKMDPVSSDLLLSALKIPEAIATFLIMGTIVSSVLPVASRIETKNKNVNDLSLYLNLILATLLGIILILVVSLFFFTPQVLELITSYEILKSYKDAGIFDDYVGVARIFLIGPMLFTIQAVLGVFLTMKKRFLVFASAGIFYNVGAVAALAIFPPNSYFAVAWGMTLGAGAASLIYWITSVRIGLKGYYLFLPNKLIEAFRSHKQDYWQTWKLFLPRILLINGAVFANLIIVYIGQDNGQVTALDIALSIQAIFMVLISAVGSVFFPDLAKIWNESKQNSRPFWNKLFSYTEKTAIVALVGTVFTFLAIPLVMWLFEIAGKGQGNADYIIQLARIATLGLVFQAVNEILIKYFFVRERAWQPVIISVSGTLIQIAVTYGLFQIIKDAGVITSFALVANSLTILVISFVLIRKDYKADLNRPEQPEETEEITEEEIIVAESEVKMLPYSGV